jgi:hypothetical protein
MPMAPPQRPFQCAQCGGTFESPRADEDAQAEAAETFGVRGDAPPEDTPNGEGMAIVCDDCYQAFMKWWRH